MIYDQAFYIKNHDGSKFISNFKYTVKPDQDPALYSNLAVGDYGKFNSQCHASMVGFLQMHGNVFHCATAN